MSSPANGATFTNDFGTTASFKVDITAVPVVCPQDVIGYVLFKVGDTEIGRVTTPTTGQYVLSASSWTTNAITSVGTYALKAFVYDAGGTFLTWIQHDITVNGPTGCTAQPTRSASNDAGTVCSGNSFNLSATDVPGASYSWTGPNSFASTSRTPTAQAAGTYTVTITLAGYCNATPSTVATYKTTGCGGDPCAGNYRSADNVSNLTSGLNYKYFQQTFNNTDGIASATPVAAGTVSTVSLSPRQRDEQIGFEYTGYIDVPTDGQYTFYTESDDGSKLWIGETEVVNNDYFQGMTERSGQLCLRAGKHAIRVRFFQGTGGFGLVARWAGPGVAKQEIGAGRLFRVQADPCAGAVAAPTISGNANFCTNGGYTILTAACPTSGSTPRWDNGQTTATRSIQVVGSYSVSCTNGTCTSPGTATTVTQEVCDFASNLDDANCIKISGWLADRQHPNQSNIVRITIDEGTQDPFSTTIVANVTRWDVRRFGLNLTDGGYDLFGFDWQGMPDRYKTGTHTVRLYTANGIEFANRSFGSTPVTATSNSPVAIGGTLSLSATSVADASYAWSGPAFSSNQQNPTLANVGATASGTYSVTLVKDACWSSANTTVLINALPQANAPTFSTSPTVPGSNTLAQTCQGTTLYFHSGCSTGSVHWIRYTAQGGFMGEATQNPLDFPGTLPTDLYYYAVGCKSAGGQLGPLTNFTVTVVANPPAPMLTATSTLVTAGTPVTLTAAGCSGIVTWSTGAVGPTSITVTPTVTTRYDAICTLPGVWCQSPGSSLMVTVVNRPVIAMTAGSSTNPTLTSATNTNGDAVFSVSICSGGNLTLSNYFANPTSTALIERSLSSGNVLYNGQLQPADRGEIPLPSGFVMNGTWGPYAVSNGLSGTISQSYTPYYDTNGNNQWDTGEIKGNRLTLVYYIEPALTATIVGIPTICAGQVASLTATGGSSYRWSNGTLGSVLSTTIGGVYSVTVSDAAGCSGFASTTVTVNSAPTIGLSATPAVICAGQSATLTASGGTSYSWTPGNGTGASVVVNPVTTTTYTARVGNAAGCTSASAITVTVNPSLSVLLAAQGSLNCTTTTTLLTAQATGAISYSFTGPGVVAQNGANATVNQGGSYSVTVRNAAGCTGTNSTFVVSNQTLPVVAIASSGTVGCGTGGVVLTALVQNQAAVPAPFTYAWSGGIAGSGSSVTATQAGIYTVTVTAANGCTGQASTTVGQTGQIGMLTLQPAGLVSCTAGTQLTASAVGATIYSFSGPNDYSKTGTNPTVTVNAPGTYTLVASNPAGCSATTTALVGSDYSTPTTGLPATVTICAGNSTTLTAGAGWTSYLWQPGNTTFTSLTVAPAQTTTYTATLGFGTCSQTATVTVNVVSRPSSPTLTATVTGTVGSLTAVVAAAGCANGSTLQWAAPGGATPWTAVLTQATTFTAACQLPGGCASQVEALLVTVPSVPQPTISSTSGAICAGQSVTLTATNCPAGQVRWVGGPSGVASWVVTPLTSTSYTAFCSQTQTNGTANGSVASYTVAGANALPVTVSVGGSLSITGQLSYLVGQTISLSVVSSLPGSLTYTWTGPAGSNFTATGLSMTRLGASTGPGWEGTYLVTARSGQGVVCSAGASVTVVQAPASLTVQVGGPISCTQPSASLTVTGGSSYTLSGPSPSAPQSNTTGVFTVTQAATYTITATANTSIGQQTGMTTATVQSQTAAPTLTLSVSGTLTCALPSVTLTAISSSTGLRYSFSGPGLSLTNTTGSAPVSQTGTYSVTATNGFGCTATASTTVTSATAPPPASMTASGPLTCTATSVTLTAAPGGLSYTFTGAGVVSQTANQAVVNRMGTYTVVVTGAGGCSATANAPVLSLTATPTASLSVSGPLGCGVSSVSLTAGGGVRYAFAGPGLSTTNTTGVASTTQTGTYSVTVSEAGGCTATASANVSATSGATVSLTAGGSIGCLQTSVVLTASASGPVSQYRFAGPGLSQAGASATAMATQTGTFSVTITTTTGCTATATTLVTGSSVPPTPSLIASGSLTCGAGSVTLTAGGGTRYAFAGPGLSTTNTTGVASASLSGTYSVTVTNALGCSATTTLALVSASPAATATLGSSGTLTCATPSATLTAGGGFTYRFDGPSLQTQAGNIATVNQPGLYTVVVTDASGCTAAATTTVSASATFPILSLTPRRPLICGPGSVTLTMTGAQSLTWSTGATSLSALVVSPTSTSVYSVSALGAGCANAIVFSTTVTVGAIVTATIGGPLTVCAGQSATLTAGGGTSYQWSTGQSTTAIVVSPSSTSAYSVTATSAVGCTAIASATLTVVASPTATITGAMTACAGWAMSLTATGGSTYRWSTGQTTPVVSVVPTNSTVYTVTVTNAQGCTAAASQSVTTTPSVSITGDLTLCTGSTGTLTANVVQLPGYTGAIGYTWSERESTGQNFTTPSISISPTATKVYSVTVTDALLQGQAGCTASASVTVVVDDPPVAVITPASPALTCPGVPISLTASGGSAYLWSTGETTPTIVVSGTATATFSVTVSKATGCTGLSTASVTVSRRTAPVVAIAPLTATVCAGLTVGLTASGANSYTWSTGQTTAAISVTPTLTTVYSVTGRALVTGCTAVRSMTVTVPNPPVVITPQTSTICSGNSQLLSATGTAGSTYRWSAAGNPSTPTITVSPLTTTTYNLTVTSAGGCTALGAATVSVASASAISVGGTLSVCAGGSTTLTASGANSYTWNTGQSTSAIVVGPASTTAYSVSATNSGGCVSSTAVTVTVGSSLSALISPTSPTICAGQAVTLVAAPSSGSATGYNWNIGTTTSATLIATPTSTTAYSVTLTTATGCTATTSTSVVVGTASFSAVITSNIPASATSGSATPGSSATINAGTPLSLTATTNPAQPGSLTYTWSGPNNFTATGGSISLPTTTTASSGTYAVTVSTSGGCTTTARLAVTVSNCGITLVTNPTLAQLTVAVGSLVSMTAIRSGTPTDALVWTSLPTSADFMPNSTTTTGGVSTTTGNVVYARPQTLGTQLYSVSPQSQPTCFQQVRVSVIEVACTCTDCDNATSDPMNVAVASPAATYANVVETTYLAEGGAVGTGGQVTQRITYFDGFGRPMQVAQTGVSPDAKDILLPVEYDAFGRNTKSYLPYVGGGNGAFQAGAVSDQATFYKRLKGDADGANAFAVSLLENSPLQRLTQQGSVGQAWQPDAANTSKEGAVKAAYRFNTQTEAIAKLTLDDTDNLFDRDIYGDNQLFVSEAKDPKNNKVETFINLLGQTVAKIVYNGSEKLITYYAYDTFGRLRFLLPPAAADQVAGLSATNINFETEGAVNKQIYWYKYDQRGRVVEKKTPDADAEEMVYNKYDQMVLYRSGLQQSPGANNGTWLYTKYDVYGRTIATGVQASTNSRVAQQAQALTTPYYGDNAYPTTGTTELVRNTYDQYSGQNPALTPVTGFDLPAIGFGSTITAFGKLISRQESVLKRSDLTGATSVNRVTTYFYDQYGRTIQTHQTNHLGGIDVASVQRDFAGRTLKTHLSTAVSTTTTQVLNQYTYDAVNRVKMVCQKVNNGQTEPLARYQYNDLGEVTRKIQGCGIQAIDYNYDLRGRLTAINNPDPALLAAPNKKQVFGLSLAYDLNDNITKQEWGNVPHFRAGATTAPKRTYDYAYDAMQRLTAATYSGGNGAAEGFSLPGISYDKMGNLTSLQRLAGGTLEDNLTYWYAPNTNRLRNVKDNGVATSTDLKRAGFFRDANPVAESAADATRTTFTASDDYDYDLAGNLTKDKNRNITSITYNALGLAETITFGSGASAKTIDYVYSGGGEKLQKLGAYVPGPNPSVAGAPTPGAPIQTQLDYVAGMVYTKAGSSDRTLSFLTTAEGRALPPLTAASPNYRYEYQQTDHQGNLRTACRCGEQFDANGQLVASLAGEDPRTVVQANHYDPWGIDLGDIETPAGASADWWGANSGSEKSLAADGSYTYDTDYRSYNPALGRFGGVDALTDLTPGISPYQFGYNNPANYTDPSGLFAWGCFFTEGLGLALRQNAVGGLLNAGFNVGANAITGGPGPGKPGLAQAVSTATPRPTTPTIGYAGLQNATVRTYEPSLVENVDNLYDQQKYTRPGSYLSYRLFRGIANDAYITYTVLRDGKQYGRDLTGRFVSAGEAQTAFVMSVGNAATMGLGATGAQGTSMAGMFRRGGNTAPFSELQVRMSKKIVREIAQDAGIGLKGLSLNINRQPELIGRSLYGSANGRTITLFPDAFVDTETLVRTLGHERTHIFQYKIYGQNHVQNNVRIFENAAFGAEEDFVKYWLLK